MWYQSHKAHWGKKVEKQKTSVSECQNTTVSICSSVYLFTKTSLTESRQKREVEKEKNNLVINQGKMKTGDANLGLCLGSPACPLFLWRPQLHTESCWACQSSLEEQHVEKLETADWNPDHTALGPLCADRDVRNGAKLPSIACFCWYFIFDFIVPSSLSICLWVKLCSLSEEISAITSNVLHRKILLRRSKYYAFTMSLLTLSSQTNNCNFNILTL